MSKRFSRAGLLSGVGRGALLAVFALSGGTTLSGQAMAASELATNAAVDATDATGLIESNVSGASAITSDSSGGAITFGAFGTPALSVTSGKATTITHTITTSGAANGVVYAGDVVLNAGAGTTLAITATNDNITFQGNVTKTVGTSNTITGAAGKTVTFDTPNAADNTIDATVVGAANSTLAVTNTTAAGNTMTFSGAVGSGTAFTNLTIGAATTATFNSTVAANTITLNSGTTTTYFNGDVTGAINFTADGTAIMADGKKIVGAVTTSTNNTGTLAFASGFGPATLISGDIGTSSNKLAMAQASSGAGITQTFGGDINASSIRFYGSDAASTFAIAGNVTGSTVQLNTNGTITMAAGKSIAAAVIRGIKGAASIGTISFLGGTTFTNDIGTSVASRDFLAVNVAGSSSIGSNIYAKTVNLNGGSGVTYIMGANKTLGSAVAAGSTNLAASTTLDLGGYTLSALSTGAASFTTAANSAIKLTIGNTQATTGQIVLGGTAATFSNAAGAGNALVITPTIIGTSVHSGDKVTLVTGGAAGPTLGSISVANSSGLISWSAGVGDGAAKDRFGTYTTTANDVILTASVASASSALSGVSTSGAAAIDTLTAYTGTNAQLVTLNNAVLNASTSESKKAAEQLRPEINGGATQGSQQAANQIINTVNSRGSQVRLTQNDGVAGVSTGEALKGLGVWAQGFGFYGEQGKRLGIDGFSAVTGGMTVGADTKVAESVRVGAAFGYANTSVSDKGANDGNSTGINSYQGTVYANYTGAPWYLNGSAAYTRHEYDASRKVVFTGFSDIAKASYSGNQYTVATDAGYPVTLGKVVLTPVAGVSYSNLAQDGYTETSNNGAALKQDGTTTWSTKSSLGTKLSTTMDTIIRDSPLRFTPEVRAIWLHEFHESAMTTTAAYAAGGSSFNSIGATQARDSGVLGLSLTMMNASNISVSANYDAEVKQAYVGHTGTLQIRAEF